MPIELPPSDHLPAGFGWRWHDLRPVLFYGHYALASFNRSIGFNSPPLAAAFKNSDRREL